MRFNVDETRLQQREDGSRSIVGPIEVEVLGEFFPGAGWHDFPVVIVSWWIDELTSLDAAGRNKCRLLFMDGPYYLELERDDEEPDLAVLRCFEDRNEVGSVTQEFVSISSVLAEVKDLARRLVLAGRDRGFASRDLDALSAQVGV